MFKHGKILELDDFFVGLNDRRGREVYFYRINGYTEEIGKFIKKYYKLAQREGIVIEGKIPNPDEKNLAFYQEMMGFDFQMNETFILTQLEQWLPRVNKDKRTELASCMYGSLEDLQKVQIAYRERVAYWYPDNYCSLDAVEFFYNAVNNYRADSLKEAINLYETALHQRRVEDTQKQALKEQRFANMANLVMQGAAIGEMKRHNAMAEFEMQRANRTLNDIQTRL